MYLLTFRNQKTTAQPTLGIKTEAGILDVQRAAQGLGLPAVRADAASVIAGGKMTREALEALAQRAAEHPDAPWFLPESDIAHGPCIPPPEKIVCVGLNYRRHAQESGMPIPEVPVLFSKFNNALAAHRQDVPLPTNAQAYDYEVELGVVIGRKARYVSEAEALNYVFGYCTLNDLSVRDLQMRTSQWLLGKTLDRFLPTGPYLVTADEIDDPQDLRLQCWMNDQLRQDSNTSDMVFSVAEIISYLSQYMTLKPGDLISTGTPEGVILGMEEKRWLRPGDIVSVEVEKLGRLTNRMVSENAG
jgi:2-keto-4-pentenoate hydratase/2-oxohepta-3-ene-1,7-dioic acid hydratase in catechol pathway